jgi:hypothetical protein
VGSTGDEVERTAEETEESAKEVAESRPLRIAARVGLGTNGLIHLLVAWLAVRVAVGSRERADQAGALQAIASEPFGRVPLWVVTGGFAAVVIWRLREAFWGFSYVRDKGQRTQKRLFAVVQVAVFTALALLSGRVAAGSGAGGGGQGLTAHLLRFPGGRWLLAAIGVGVVITGAAMAVRGGQRKFTEDMDLESASPTARRAAKGTGVVGSVAKGISVMIIGVVIGVAAVTYQPARAEGLDSALKTLANQPYGPVLLIAVAAGLASYGTFAFFDARYHRL